MRYAWLLCYVWLAACAIKPRVRPALFDQILLPRPGHVGKLTNQTCKTYKGSACIEQDLIEYDLRDVEVRRRLLEVRLVCGMQHQRYRPCEELPGLCRQTYVKKGWFGRELKLVEFLDAENNYQRMIDNSMICAAQFSEWGKEMFEEAN